MTLDSAVTDTLHLHVCPKEDIAADDPNISVEFRHRARYRS